MEARRLRLNIARLHNKTVLINQEDKKRLIRKTSESSGIIKTTCGICNNAAWAAVLEAHDHVKKHSRYRHQVKRAFRDVIETFRKRELLMVHAQKNRLFHLDDLLPEHRARYGNITDAQYYEYWCSTGQTAYIQTKPWVMNVRNKYKNSLEAHHIGEAETVSWAMAADACLRLAQAMYCNVISICVEHYGVATAVLDEIFGMLNLKVIADKWDAALTLLSPETGSYELTDFEQRNIQLSLDQLMEEWMSMATITDSLSETIVAYDDIFRTKAEQKRALREVADLITEKS